MLYAHCRRVFQLGEVRHEIIAASDDETREALLRAHYDKRIEDLTMQLQTADGKAVAFHAECRALGRRLEQATKMRGRAVEELEAANSQITQLQVCLPLSVTLSADAAVK